MFQLHGGRFIGCLVIKFAWNLPGPVVRPMIQLYNTPFLKRRVGQFCYPAGLTQLVEYVLSKHKVQGSIP